MVLFFQAEDGIRDLVRSRGLGDVYKRQIRDYRPEYQQYFGLVLLGLLAGTLWGTLSPLMVIERAPVSHAMNESLQWAAGATTTLVGLSVMKIGVLAMFLAPIAAGLASVLHGCRYAARRVSLRPSLHWSKQIVQSGLPAICLLYTSDAADEPSSVDPGGRRILKKKKHNTHSKEVYTRG